MFLKNFLVSITLLLVLVACASTPPVSLEDFVWPKPPDKPRIAYEITLKNNRSLNPYTDEERLRDFAIGKTGSEPGSDEGGMLKPYDVAAYKGLIVVTDSLLNVAHVFDVPRKKMFPIGWRKEGKLSKPLGVAIDAEKNIYIVDAGRGAVVKYDSLGLYLTTYGHPEDFSRISDIAISPSGQRVYILDRGGVESKKHRITVYDKLGNKIRTIGTRGHKPGEFNHPTQLATGSDGRIYVLDSGNFRVQVFDEAGNYMNHWGQPGDNAGNFARPRGIAVDENNRVFVTDSAYQNFQIFNDSGQLLLNVGQGGGSDLPGNYLLPAGIAVDETRRVYVVDQIRRKLEVFRLLSVED